MLSLWHRPPGCGRTPSRRIDLVPALGNLAGRHDTASFRNFPSRPMNAPEKSFSDARIAWDDR